jgi:hypothetical protein
MKRTEIDKESKEKESLLKRILLRICPKNLYRSFYATIIFTIFIIVLGMVLENNDFLNGQRLSLYMQNCFSNHKAGITDGGYILYYILLYLFVIAYVGFTLLIILINNTKGWCALSIIISIIFVVFMNAYLTLMLQYDVGTDNSSNSTVMYQMHMSCFISVVTIIIGVAGIKMTYIYAQDRKEEEREKQ